MNSESREQLLSAYLDDELSPDERAQVEKWLAEDVGYRKLRDEWLAARAAIQSLPRHRLDHDLSASVLRRAERVVLDGGALGRSAAESGRHVSPSSQVRQWFSRGRSWRMVAWPAAAIAAALLVAFLGRQQGERQVALETPRGATSIRAAEELGDRVGSYDGAAKPQVTAQAARDEPAPGAGSPAPAESLRRRAMPSQPPGPSAAPAVELHAVDAKGKPRNEAVSSSPTAKEAAEIVVLDVDPQYIETGALQSWLDQRKIAWRRLPAAASQVREVDAATPSESDDRVQEVELQLTDEELANLRAEAARSRGSVRAAETETAGQRAQAADKSAKLAADAADEVRRRRIVIRLRASSPRPDGGGPTP
jgi:hypothetical protein